MKFNNNDGIIKYPLDEILKRIGYFEKREKSSRNYKTLTNDQDDTVVISCQANGHYLYFNPNDDKDRGNIYNFAKNRGLMVQDLIGKNANELKSEIKPRSFTNTVDNKIIENFNKLNKTDKNSWLKIN